MKLLCMLATIVVLLAGCAGTSGPAHPATPPAPSPAASVTPTPASTPPPTAHPTAERTRPPTPPPLPTRLTATPQPPARPGEPGNGVSYGTSMSADGRFVAFASEASNLVPGDTNRSADVFVHDRLTGRTERVSVASDGTQGDNGSGDLSISADGRWVAFGSIAADLVEGDRNNQGDIFIHDRETGRTAQVSLGLHGEPADDNSAYPSVSANGRWVAFESTASNLVPGDSNRLPDIFVYDLQTQAMERASVASDGAQQLGGAGPACISADGRWVAFVSDAANLVPGQKEPPSPQEVYVHDRETGRTELVSVGANGDRADGTCGSPAISADGRWVAFASYATNLVAGSPPHVASIYLRGREAATTRWVAVHGTGNIAQGGLLSLSADGRWLAFDSDAEDLVPGDTNGQRDVFVYDRETSRIERVSAATGGAQAEGASGGWPRISADGRFVAFTSHAANLLPGGAGRGQQIYVHDRHTGRTELVSVASE